MPDTLPSTCPAALRSTARPRAKARAAGGPAVALRWPRPTRRSSLFVGAWAWTRSCFGGSWSGNRARALDLLLELDDAVQQRLGSRRASGHVDIHRNDAVAASNHRIGIVVVAAAVRAGAHGDDPARLGHLVVDLAQRGSHFVDERA